MPAASFKQYEPSVAPYAKRVTETEWEQHHDLLTNLHNRHIPRSKMLEELAIHNFHPSMGQLVSQMMQWGLMPHGKRPRQPPSTRSVPATAESDAHMVDAPPTIDGSLDKTGKPSETDTGNSHAESSPSEAEGISKCEKIPQGAVGASSTGSAVADLSCRTTTNETRLNSISTGKEQTLFLPFGSGFVATLTSRSNAEPQPEAFSDTFYSLLKFDANPTIHKAPHPSSSLELPTSYVGILKSDKGADMFRSNLEKPQPGRQIQDKVSASQQDPVKNSRRWCCDCNLFVTANWGIIESASVFFWNVLHQCSSDQSLTRATALVYIWHSTTTFTPEQDAEYRSLLRSSTKEFLKLATRHDVKNPIVYDLTRELAGIYAVLHEDNQEQSVTWPRSYDTSKKQTVPLYERCNDWHRALRTVALYPAGYDTSYDRFDMAYQRSLEANGNLMLKVAGKSRELLLANITPMREYLLEMMDCKDTDRIWDENLNSLIQNFKVSEAALRLVKILSSSELSLRSAVAGSGLKLAPTLLVTMIDAIGLVVAQELASILGHPPIVLFCFHWRDGFYLPLTSLVVTAVKRLPGHDPTSFVSLETMRQSGSLQRLLDLYDRCKLAPLRAVKPAPSYHSLHPGPCYFEAMWKFLDSSITTFDKKVPLVQRPLNRQRWPKLEELEASDAMSIRTSSSDNSLSRFQALAIRIRFRDSTSSMGSLQSKWSGHMSEDSWRLNDIMEIDELSKS